ncbi:MAG: tRNA pseudouridine(38-40) synthase TruA [Candidatus Thorarchaeota archaeon]
MPSYITRLFYLGDRYHGSQFQPNLITVQGELIEALNQWDPKSKTDYSTQTVQFSGRTDRGVHSIGQIVLIQTEKKLDIDRVNRHLPSDIALWASTLAPSNFNPRYDVLMRHYRYYFDVDSSDMDLQSMRTAAQLLSGTRDFFLLSKPDGDRPTTTTILNASLLESDDGLTMDIFGTNFLWKLIRKTVSLLLQIGTGVMNIQTFSNHLNGHDIIPGGIEPAPPECLVLVETAIPIRMNTSRYALSRIQKQLSAHLNYLKRSRRTLSAISDDYFSHQRSPS